MKGTHAAANPEKKKQDGQRHAPAHNPRAAAPNAGINPTWTALALRSSSLAPLETAFSADLSDVNIHVAPEKTRGTEAVTSGSDIYLARPMRLDAPPGRGVLAHEIAHVVQQRRGGAGAPAGTGDKALEAEAGRAAADVEAGRSASIRGAARWGAPQNFTTEEGDELPDPVIVDWGERFQISFSTRTTGYGDVKVRYRFQYLGSFHGEARDLDFVIERDPGGTMVEGTRHSRRIHAKIVEAPSDSIKLDVYGDGTVLHQFWHTVEWDPGGREVHAVELFENGNSAAFKSLTSIDIHAAPELHPVSGIVGTVTPPAFKPDPDRGPQLPTGTLLDLIVDRLDETHVPITVATWMLRIKIDEDMKSATQAGDDEGVTRNARRLLDLLTYLGPIFPALEEMDKPELYLGNLAPVALEEVSRITHLYISAMLEAYSPPGNTPSLAEADKAMAAFPDWVKFLYLRDDSGVKSLISQIPGLVDELRNIRSGQDTSSAMAEADNLVRLSFGNLGGELEGKRISAVMDWRSEKENVLDSVQALYTRVQHSIGLLTAMIWYEQLSAIYDELGSFTNFVMEQTLWGERTERAGKYKWRLFGIVLNLSHLKGMSGIHYNLSDPGDKEAVAGALTDLATLCNSEQFKSDLDDFATRIKWVNRAAFLSKLAVIVAAAALTSGSAASAAFAGLRAAGAGVALATAGELAIGGLVFTAVSREGQKILFGKAEGNFFVDWFWNTVTLGVLKAANYGFTKIFKLKGLDPDVAKIRFGLGRTVTSMISLHGIGEMQHLAMTGEWMSNDERVNAIFQNVALMAGLEAGRFITTGLENRLTAAIISKLQIDLELANRIKGLALQREPLKARLDALSRGEAAPAEIDQTLNDIEKLWAEELRLVNDGVNRKILTQEEMGAALAGYNTHIAGMQLRLSQLGIEAPMPGGTTFRPIQRGVVAYTPEGRAAIEKYYTPDPKDPTTAGKSLKELSKMPGVLEGRLPNGELTYYVPEGSFPKGMPKAAQNIAARDAAVLAAKADPHAAEGLARLNEGLKGSGATKPFSQRSVDDILGSMPIELIPEFLRAMADPGFTAGRGQPFYEGLASSPAAVEFARAYGAGAVIKIWGAAKQSWPVTDTLLSRAQIALETAETAAARQEFLDSLLKGDNAAVNKLLDNVKAKVPREVPVNKATLGVNRSSTEWQKLRNDAAKFAEKHDATWIKQDKLGTLDKMADMRQIHARAMSGKYAKWVGNRDAIENLLDKFDALAEEIKKADPTDPTGKGPWAKAVAGSRNSLIGAIGEAVGRPAGVPKHQGGFKVDIHGVSQVVPEQTPGATIPDYQQQVGGVVEWVNIKSDVLTPDIPSSVGTYSEGVSAAGAYRTKAVTEAGNLPAGNKYSIQFLRDPLRARDPDAGRRTEKAMLDKLFNEGSPVYRVKFGTRPWISRDQYLAGGGK